MEILAIHGGPKTINKEFSKYNSIGKEELGAVIDVMNSGVLSQFLGEWSPDFYWGRKVQEFERNCEKYFDVKHAICVNSWTSGLIAALGAISLEPGDEVIVSPWTMSASATAILHWNGIPVFADIEMDTYGLDPESVEKNISPYTKAIMVVDIFGHSAKMDEILRIAKKYNLRVISDTAQSPGSMYKGKYSGTLADIGGFSLNYHKHIHTGEGGILVTNSDELAERMQLIRNHAEAVVKKKGTTDLVNMIGYNFRMGELEAAIGIEQLKKLNSFVGSRQAAAKRLASGIAGLRGLKVPIIDEDCSHSFYAFPMQVDTEDIGVKREFLHAALVAEGVKIADKYANIHLLPIFQKKIAYGSKGFPWNSEVCRRDISYKKGICPNAEFLQDYSFMVIGMCTTEMSSEEIDYIISAFKKVWANLIQLR